MFLETSFRNRVSIHTETSCRNLFRNTMMYTLESNFPPNVCGTNMDSDEEAVIACTFATITVLGLRQHR